MRRFRYLLLALCLVMPALFYAQGGTPPVARNVVVTTQEGVAKTGTLLATDADGSALTFSITTPPGKGTLTIVDATTGAFTYTPNAGAVGYDSFTFQASDGSSAATATGAVFIVASSPRWPGQTVRASVVNGGVQQTVPSSFFGVPSADGRFVVFTSGTVDEAAGVFDLNVFVYDRQSGQTELVSKNASGQPIAGIFPSITADGRYVAYTTFASSFPGNPTGIADVVVYDRQTAQTTRVSVDSNGTPGNGENVFTTLSADGRYVAFSGSSTNLSPGDTDSNEDVYLRDRQTGQTTLVSISSSGVKGNAGSWLAQLSADGRFIAFVSEATNLVANDTNNSIDVFVRDVVAGQTTRVSVGNGGVQATDDSSLGGISADGRFVVFASAASNLVPGDTNGVKDVFVRDRLTGQTSIVSVSSTGALGNGAVEGDGTISADGRFVVFRSTASNLVPGDTNGVSDEFVHDRLTGQTVRVNVASDGSQANAASVLDDDDCCALPVISADGRSVVITSLASNLVPSDTNGLDDVFVVGPVTASPATIAVGGSGGSRTVDVTFDFPGTAWTATTSEPWITLNAPVGGSTSGTVSFTVAPNTGAARTGTIIAALQTITVNQGPPTVPVAQNSTISTPEDVSVASALVGSDADGDAITYSLVTQPALGAVVLTNPSTGAFTYTPALNFNGVDIFTFRVTDGATFSNTATVTVNVTPVNDLPVATNSTLIALASSLTTGVLAVSDVDADPLTFSIATPPSQGAVELVNASTGVYTYTPVTGFSGSDSFTFSAADAGGSSNVATVSITVSPLGGTTATFHIIGDLPGGPDLSLVRDATKVDGVVYAVGASSANNQLLCVGPNNPAGCVTQISADTAVLWTSNSGIGTLTPLPNLVTPATPPTNLLTAGAITRDGNYIASQARSSSTTPGQALAVRVTRNGLVNLNLAAAPFPALSPSSSAQAISDDGAVVYGITGNPTRAVRFDITTSSSTLIPLLLGSHTGNNIAGRGTSIDGSVMVGTSFVAPFTGTNGRAFRYVHGSPAGTVTAIPLLAGGTWNRPLAVSPDGRRVLVAGNSSSQSNGEVYLYDSTNGTTTPLGSPNTPWAPGAFGGMTADGSVVVVTFSDPGNSSTGSHAYVHNAHGWFHLTTILAAAGVNLFPEWRVEGMRVHGVSADGTLVFGSIVRNLESDSENPSEGFVAELPPGYLASFDVPAVPQTDTAIVGVWTDTGGSGQDVAVFLADGTYFLIDTRHGSQPAGEFTSGFERGRYHWDASTGLFTFATLLDTNGTVGLSGGNGAQTIPATVSGDDLVIAGEIFLKRVKGPVGSVVGGWFFGDPRVSDDSGVLVLFEDGKFVFAEDGNGVTDPGGRDGVEAGTYTWNAATGAFTLALTLDMTGEWGFGNGAGTGGSTTAQLSPDELHLNVAGAGNPLTRIENPQAVAPVITSALTASAISGSPFAYAITATHASSFGATGLPSGLLVNTTTGAISGTTTALGTFDVTISASNSFNLTTTASLTITVSASTGLTASSASGSFGGSTTLTATLMSNGTPFAGQQIAFSLNGSPKGTATTNASGVATLNDVSLAGIGAGSYPTGVTASFAGDATHAPSSATASLTVAKAIPVVTWPAPADINHGTPLSTVQLNATANVPGTFAYTPSAGTVLNVGTGQTLSALFTPTDVANFATVQAQVTINVLNAAPVARGVVLTTQEGVAKSSTLLAIDAESDPLTFSIVTPPTKGTLTLVNPSTGAFTYTPNAGAIGYDSFVFRAAESGGASSTAVGSVFIVATSPRWPGQTVRVNVANDGSQANGASNLGASPSADGRFIAFASSATNLSTGIPAGSLNVYVRDRLTGETSVASVAGPGGPAIGGALPTITPDGRYVAFTSLPTSLPGGNPAASFDAVLHDRVTGQSVRVNVSSNGTPGNGENILPVVSADGRYVAFYGSATNLVPADTDTNEDVYLRDLQTSQTTLVSVSSTGVKGNSNSWRPTMSVDGRYVAFQSEATNLVPGDNNNQIDVFVRDLWTGQTIRGSVATGGAQLNGSSQGVLSYDGRFLVFSSSATNAVAGDTNNFGDVFVRDLQTGQTTRVSVSSTGAQGNEKSEDATISADGRFVAFRSWASNLVPGDTNGLPDEFVHDRLTGQTVRINVASDGTQANAVSTGDEDGCCITPVISADGRSIVMMSLASNLVAGDTNNADDVFVVGPVLVAPTTLSVPASGGTQSVNVTADYPGPWTATTTTPWITIDPPGGGSASGTVTFTVAPNSGTARTGSVVVALQTVVVNQGATVTVTVNTSPAGAPFVVDGVSYSSSQTFQWVPGTTHSLSTAESVAAGTRYVFRNWSDGGAISHEIIAPEASATYTATFTRQYLLTASAAPADSGTFTLAPPSPASDGYYDEGTSVSIRFNPDLRHKFSDWSGDLTGTANPQSITMSSPRTVAANAIVLTEVAVTTVPGGTATVDGQTFSASRTFFWVPGSTHSVSVTPAQAGSAGTRYVFDRLLLDGAPVSMTFIPGPFLGAGVYTGSVTAPAPAASSSALVFSFRSRFSIATNASPANAGTITFDPPSPDGFYDAGTEVNVLALPGTNYAFNNWIGDLTGTTNPQTLTVNAPKTVTASFVPPSIVVTSVPLGRTVIVDGVTYTSPAGFVWAPGSAHTISTTASQTAPGSQFTFASWSDAGALTHTVVAPAGPAIYTATFDARYQLTISASPVGSGSVSPASGSYYPSGQTVSVSAVPSSPYNFGSWSGPVVSSSSTSTSVTMNGPTTVVANFTPVVRLTTQWSIVKFNYPGFGVVYSVYIYACNSGALAAQNVHLSALTLNTSAYPSTGQLPTETVGPNGSCQFLGNPTFVASSIGASGTAVPLKYTVTYSGGGPIATSLRVTLPQP